jgi:hypothetical protein
LSSSFMIFFVNSMFRSLTCLALPHILRYCQIILELRWPISVKGWLDLLLCRCL